MTPTDIDQEKERRDQELRIGRLIAFASGLFQGDVTIRTLLESLAEAVVIIDSSGTILLVNATAEKMFGYSREELIGMPHASLIPERFGKIHEEHEAAFFTEPRIRPMGQLLDLAGRRRDGSEFPVEISLSKIETVNGVLVMAFISDITLRKEYESSLRKSEQLFHILVEGVKDYAIFMLDPQGNVLTWNEGAERLTGYRDEEIIGRHFSCFYPEADRAGGKPADELKTAAAEERVEDEGWRIRKDGSRFWANVIITALRNENGALRGLANVTRDMTERRLAEEELRKREQRLQRSQEIAHLGSWELDLFADKLTWSDEVYRIFGLQPQEFGATYEAFLETVHPDDRPAVDEAYSGSLRQGLDTYEIDHRVVRKSTGEIRHVHEKCEHFRDESGRITRSVGMVHDITERKQAQEKIERLNTDLAARAADLESANRELEAFNYTVAHDLRKPLTVINGYCQILKELCSDKLDEKCAGYLEESYEGTLRMSRLIDALLEFSRLAHAQPKRAPVDLSAAAEELAAELKMAEPGRNVTFRIAAGMTVEGDANLLRVVVANLLGNAWKYTAEREEALIEFDTFEYDGKRAFCVRDNGVGFDMADAAELFIPFRRLSSGRRVGGLGIGLATVERIIKRHGGRVWAEGAPGKGAAFCFTVPEAGASS